MAFYLVEIRGNVIEENNLVDIRKSLKEEIKSGDASMDSPIFLQKLTENNIDYPPKIIFERKIHVRDLFNMR